MNKKLLVLLPIAMLALAGCNQPAGGGEGGGGTPGGDSGEGGGEGGGQGGSEKLVISFASRTEIPASGSQTWLNILGGDEKELGFLKQCVTEGNAALLTEASSRTVCVGNGTGGAYENQSGFIKFGNSSSNGTLSMSFSKAAKKVTFVNHDFYKKSDAYPTNTNGINVNDAKQLCVYTAEGTFGETVFTLEDPSEEIAIESYCTQEGKGGRMFVQSIAIEF